MDKRGILVFILSGISVVSALSGKGYFCRDPDTGHLHSANSTWQSTTFCGNYSCKLRRKSTFEGKTPVRALNVTVHTKSRTQDDDTKTEDANIVPITKIELPSNTLLLDSPEMTILKSLLPPGHDFSKFNDHGRLKHNPDQHKTDDDRFLTEPEIKTISELLHNVKKSDLEAIVDVYNLAQDIYKEMDKITSQNIVEETMRLANDKPHKQQSYWYDPSYQKGLIKSDMMHQASNIMPSTVTSPRESEYPNSYFGGALTHKDFGKLPYYYPMSSFQRQSSYLHPTYNPLSPQPSVKPPCNIHNHVYEQPMGPPTEHPIVPPVHPPISPPAAVPYLSAYYPPYYYPSQPQNYGGVLKKPFAVETQKQIPPSNLLPYPFSYVQHYNTSAYPLHIYYEGMPWTRDVNTNHNQQSNHKTESSEIPSNTIQAEPKKKEENSKVEDNKPEVEILIDTLIANAKSLTNLKPEWQTDPISAHVLEEVRAHFEEKKKLLNPFLLKKKVKLERVGKVVKLDELKREKRSIDSEDKKNKEEEEFEAFIEKTTCLSDVDPGYFRMGNLTEPYPACCPQRIDDNTG